MSQLEKTIVSTAKERLQELKVLLGDGTPDEQADAMRDLMQLVELAKIKDSGLSEQAIDELLQMEAEAMKLSGADRLPAVRYF